MCEGTVAARRPGPRQSTDGQPPLLRAAELLSAGDYEQAVDCLHEAQQANERRGETVAALFLVLAQRICLACSQCQAEMRWHRQAYQEAEERELTLRRELQRLLNLVGGQETSTSPAEQKQLAALVEAALPPPEPLPPPSLWQRLRGVLSRRAGRQRLGKPVPRALREDLTPFPPARLEMPSSFRTGTLERPAETPVEKTEMPPSLPTEENGEPAVPPSEPAEAPGTLFSEDAGVVTPSIDEDVEAPSAATQRAEEALTLQLTGESERPTAPTAKGVRLPAPPHSDVEQTPIEKAVADRELPDTPSLVVHCLGPFRVYQDHRLVVEWDGLKGQAVLKYLVAHKGGPVAKEILMDVLWPDAEPEAARRNLHQAVYSLRKTLRRKRSDLRFVRFENDHYLLNPKIDVWLDFEEFEGYVRTGQQLEAAGELAEAMAEYGIAESLYQGDFLEEDLYEDWPSLQRQHLRILYLDIADRLTDHYVQRGEYTAAAAMCHKILSRDNCYEAAHRRLMRCYMAQGQRHLAVRQYQSCVEALREGLDLAPAEQTVASYQRIIAT
jgi:DNA-binding SARP family transcriptional activator